MKKQLYLLAGVAAILAGCSKTETVEQNPSTAIGFSNAWVGNSVDSKVDEITANTLTAFYVYGGYNDMTHVFENTEVSTSDQGTSWSYGAPLRYWVEGENYKFAAYAPAEAATYGTVAPDFTNGALTFTNFVSNPTNQCDLIYATASVDNVPANYTDKVTFNFNHLLSMVKFTFKSGFANDIKVTISDLKVYGMVSTGSYDQGWTPDVAKVEVNAPFNTIDVATAVNASGGNTNAESDDFAVIPQTIGGTDVTVSFTVNVKNENGDDVISTKTLSAQLPTIEWQAGNRYNYNVTISGNQVDLNPIEFGTPTVDPIMKSGDADITVQ